MFSDSDLAGDTRTPNSTAGLFLAFVGPRTCAPNAVAPKGQAAASHSSREAEIIAKEYVARVEGLPVLDFWDSVLSLSPLAGGRALVEPEASPRAKHSCKQSTNNKGTHNDKIYEHISSSPFARTASRQPASS